KTGTASEDIPQTIRAGVALHAIPKELVFAVDGEKEKNSDGVIHLGTEYVYQEMFIGRLGYQNTFEVGGGISAGLGFIWRPQGSGRSGFMDSPKKSMASEGMLIRFDYGYVDFGDLDATHRIG